MPNWVNNTIAIKKTDRKYLINKKGEVDFNLICPMPEELSKTISGGRVNECVLYYVFKTSKTKAEFFKRIKDESKTIGSYYLTLKQRMTKEEIENAILNVIGDDPDMFNDDYFKKHPKYTPMEIGEWYYKVRKKYKYSDWYSWSCANWGCKWNASDTYIREDDGLLCVSFSTPWGYPDAFLMELSKRCPFYLEWEEEQGYHGEVMFDGNDYISRYLDDFMYEENEDGDYEKIGEYNFEGMKDNVLSWGKTA